MLQRIFHLEKYGIELTGKIARARQKQDLLLSTLSGEKKGYEDISSQKLSLLKKEKKEKSEKMEKAEKEYRKFDVRTLSPVEQAYLDNIKILNKKVKGKK